MAGFLVTTSFHLAEPAARSTGSLDLHPAVSGVLVTIGGRPFGIMVQAVASARIPQRRGSRMGDEFGARLVHTLMLSIVANLCLRGQFRVVVAAALSRIGEAVEVFG